MKVFSQVFFKKLAGLGRAHKKRRFLFAKLFLCASCAKEKAVLWYFVFYRGRIIYCCFVRSTVERIMFALHYGRLLLEEKLARYATDEV